VGAEHGHRLYRHGHTPLHRLPAHVKLVTLIAFVLVVVATPREAYWAFGVYAVLLASVARLAHVPPGWMGRRMLIEAPFVFFAVLLPFIARGPRVDVLGLSLSESGLLGGWNIVAKGTLGVAASVILAATTEPRDVLIGLQRLRMPSLLVEIFAFMVRYADVVTDEMRRMRIARESRGFHARHLGHLPVVASSAGALFIRAYERGERVHLAMLSRGYAGSLPVLDDRPTPVLAWAGAAALPAAALVVATAAWVLG
jgi:cobalt/nickel transport system permease protein